MSRKPTEGELKLSRAFTEYGKQLREVTDAQIAELKAEIARLRAALEQVEWVPDGEGWARCPWCLRYEEYGDGHENDCARQTALRQESEGK